MYRHWSGVLLVGGWLLMSPPLTKDAKAPGGYRVDSEAKLSAWTQVSAHDSATDCERAKSQRAVDAITVVQQFSATKEVLEQPLVDAAIHALCVPVDSIYGGGEPADEAECPAGPAQL
jgi:hypothetical protein